MKKTKTFTSISVIILIIIGVISIFTVFKNINVDKLLNTPYIHNNIFIGGLNISNLSKEDAKKYLKDNFASDNIIFRLENKDYVYKKADFGVSYNFDEAIEKAYKLGRNGSKNEMYKEIQGISNNPKNINLNKKINQDILNKKIQQIYDTVKVNPKNPSIKKLESGFEVIEGQKGYELDKEKTKEEVLTALEESGDVYLDLNLKEIYPKYNTESLKLIKDKIGSFSTPYSNKSEKDKGRINNMKVAANKINATILYPDETFSTNKKFGKINKENGYELAPVIIDGNFEEDYGGGVCQVSSTLYNAVLYSELNVIERVNHSLKVKYLDYGYDATLAGDYIDFKFKNSSPYPIYIEAYLTEDKVICNIYGIEERPKNRNIKFEKVLVDVLEPGPKIIEYTDKMYVGQEKVKKPEAKGYKYKLYKLIYENEKLIDKVLVNNSIYKPVNAKVLVGTKKETPVINLENSKNLIQLTEDTTE